MADNRVSVGSGFGREVGKALGSNHAFILLSALLFVASAAGTIAWSASMSKMSGVAWTAAWHVFGSVMRGGAMFITMWDTMMMAMMLPTLVPMLWRYRSNLAGTNSGNPGLSTFVTGAAYFLVWTLFGMALFLLTGAITVLESHQVVLVRIAPIVNGALIVVAGAFQFTAWKERHLDCCRALAAVDHPRLLADDGSAVRHGLHLGINCVCSSGGLMVILVLLSAMDLRVMVAITIALAVERLTPAAYRAARIIGVLAVAVGLARIAMAAGIIS